MSLTVERVTNISRHIHEDTTRMLWGISAGMCEFNGCTNRLYSHHVTKESVNLGERAHIYAFSEGGKRFSRLVPRKKINDIGNLMLLCNGCHNLIDSGHTDYSAEQLFAMKFEHEERMRILSAIKPDLQSEVIIYTCPIGNRNVRIRDFDVFEGLIPNLYPAREHPISLRQESDFFDFDKNFWETKSLELERGLAPHEYSLKNKHISLFAVAPQPLLFKLGTLLNRNYNVDVRQNQGDLALWKWATDELTIDLNLVIDNFGDEPPAKAAITFELTAHLTDVEINRVLGGSQIHRIIARDCGPKCIQSKADLQAVIWKYREALNAIRVGCTPDVQVNLLFIAPASVAIEAGRQLMKGDPQVTIYDRNYLTKQWVPTLSFPKRGGMDYDD